MTSGEQLISLGFLAEFVAGATAIPSTHSVVVTKAIAGTGGFSIIIGATGKVLRALRNKNRVMTELKAEAKFPLSE